MKTQRPTERTSCDLQRQSLAWCAANQGTVRTNGLQQKLGRSKEELSYRFQGSLALPAPRFQTSSIQNCEAINFCYFRTLTLWYFVTSALRNWYPTFLPVSLHFWALFGRGWEGQETCIYLFVGESRECAEDAKYAYSASFPISTTKQIYHAGGRARGGKWRNGRNHLLIL